MYVSLQDRFCRQSLRTKIILGVVPVLAITSCTLLLPQDPYFDLDMGRMSQALGAQSRVPSALTHQASPSIASFATAEDCVEVGTWRGLSPKDQRYQHSPLLRAADTSIVLPLSSELLYFLSRGDHNAGSIEILEDGKRGSDEVRVDVQMYYSTHEILQSSKVCRMEAGPGKAGVGIFTPQGSFPGQRMFFAVKVRLPPGRSSLVHIGGLETSLPHYRHEVGDLARDFKFGSVSLRSTNEAMTVKALNSKTVEIITVNGAIKGTFKSSAVELQTSNAPIDTNVSLVHCRQCSEGVLNMRTHNGVIESRVTLLADSQDSSGGTFKVSAESSNENVEVSFPIAPLHSILHLDASTSNAPVNVSLHKTFEGEFSLYTPGGRPMVRYGQGIADPAGAKRRRDVYFDRDRRGIVFGKVLWEPRHKTLNLGSATLRSLNTDIFLSM